MPTLQILQVPGKPISLYNRWQAVTPNVCPLHPIITPFGGVSPPLSRLIPCKKPHKYKVLARFAPILPISQMGSFPHPIP